MWDSNDINLKETGNVGSATLLSRSLRLWHDILVYFISGIYLYKSIILFVRFPWELFSRMEM